MASRVLLLSLLFFSVCSLQAQDYHFGLRLGYIQSSIDGETGNTPELNSRHAFQIGLVHTIKARDARLGLSIETGYALKGARINDPTLNYRLHYLSMPVLLDIYPVKGLKLSVGPEFNFLLDARNQVNANTSFTLEEISENRWDIDGTISASYALDFFVDFGVRYTMPFSDIASSDPNINRTDLSISSFQVFFYFKVAN